MTWPPSTDRLPPDGADPLDFGFISDSSRTMSTPIALLLVILTGALLTYGASRATATVSKRPVFLRWMIAVFVLYVTLISLPVLVGF